MGMALTIAGGTAQILGFGLTYYELAHTLRREFPDYRSPYSRVIAWVSRKLRPSVPTIAYGGSAVVSAGAITRATGRSLAPAADCPGRAAITTRGTSHQASRASSERTTLRCNDA
jgi:hypothetical protein